MKIIHVLNHFLPQHIAGTEIYAYNLGKALHESGYEVLYLIPNYGKEENEEYDYKGMKVFQYAEPSVVDRALQMGKRKPDGLPHFIEVLKHENPDIIHFHELAGSNGITLHHVIAAKVLGFKTVMTFHLARYTATSDNEPLPTDVFDNKKGSFNFYRNKGFSDKTTKATYTVAGLLCKLRIDVSFLGRIGTALSVPYLVEKKRRNFLSLIDHCDKGVTIARWYHEALVKDGVSKEKLSFIEQGIDDSNLVVKIQRETDNVVRLIFVGRISHFKGVKLLIEVVKSFESNTILLDIYGDSGENDQYINECKMLSKDQEHIQFRGRLKPENIISTMAIYDVLVLPSTFSEMSPLVIREAFAAGIPVLASDSLGAKEQIQDGVNGWLFRMNDKEDLKAKLKMLVENPGLRERAKQHIPPVRSFEEVGKDYLMLYQSLLSNRGELF